MTTMTKAEAPAPRVIAHRSAATRTELLVQPEAYGEFEQQKYINDEAAGEAELFACSHACPRNVLRCPRQKESRLTVLRAAFAFAEQERVRASKVAGGK